jgi:NAD(P)-dependent dehydrogenase (short-subunit alcohol dehydrogenase family)
VRFPPLVSICICAYLTLTPCGASPRVGAFHFSHFTLPLLLKSTHLPHPATLIFTGATASLRGSAECSGFATGKFALRALAQSLAREFGPKRVHVAHLLVDGGINGPRAREYFGAKSEDMVDRLISPDGVSFTYCSSILHFAVNG